MEADAAMGVLDMTILLLAGVVLPVLGPLALPLGLAFLLM